MSDNQRMQHIDAWRFIAVSLVIVGHLIAFSNLGALIGTYVNLRPLGRFGSFGVLIFFFISGFLIARGLVREQSASASVSLRAFYLRRAFRILPPLWLYLAVLTLLVSAGAIDTTMAQIGQSALFLCNMPLVGDCSWYAGHTWSLAYEEQFYLVFPLLFLALGLMARPRTALLLLVIAILGSIGCRAFGIEAGADYLRYVSLLLTGCAAALYESRWRAPLQRLTAGPWLATGLLLGAIAMLPAPLDGYLKTILYPPGIALLVLGTPLSQRAVRAFFHHPFAGYLGTISYTVYLWQQLANALWPALAAWWTVAFILAAWLLAHASWQLLERPLIRVGARWSDELRQKGNASAALVTAG